jgi:hypothetical protein
MRQVERDQNALVAFRLFCFSCHNRPLYSAIPRRVNGVSDFGKIFLPMR